MSISKLNSNKSFLEIMNVFSSIEEATVGQLQRSFNGQVFILSGGISRSQCITGKDGRKFFQGNELAFSVFFETEAIALRQLEDTHTIRVPKVISVGKTSSESFLVLELRKEVLQPPDRN